MYRVIQSSRLYEQIVQQIEESVISGALKDGDKLPAERELAHEFGVSRTAVREAIKALQEKGLVEALPGRGTFITQNTSNPVRQSLDRILKGEQINRIAWLVEFREILEPEIAALAAARANEENIATLREAYLAMEGAKQDADAFIEADLDFHLELAEAAGNPLILSLIDSVVGLLRDQRTHTFYVTNGPARGQLHHKRILNAVERHDPEAAREAMNAHMQQVREDSGKTASEEKPEI
jgi:GntR family transcriptional repressor for pyruvate dehydrogenase complex